MSLALIEAIAGRDKAAESAAKMAFPGGMRATTAAFRATRPFARRAVGTASNGIELMR
ncbi:hypothetical protein [Nitrobacter sp.]|uniref:hypothetical protein n=1 Tax=Nitrobacter sp. TaxID=29420 RepID=UPI00399D7640